MQLKDLVLPKIKYRSLRQHIRWAGYVVKDYLPLFLKNPIEKKWFPLEYGMRTLDPAYVTELSVPHPEMILKYTILRSTRPTQ